MEVLNPISAGMDVHRDTVVVTILRALPNGRTWKDMVVLLGVAERGR